MGAGKREAQQDAGWIFCMTLPEQLTADVLYTDVWASMGLESEAAQRRKAFLSYQINDELAAHAKPDYVFMHCLPAHRERRSYGFGHRFPSFHRVSAGRKPPACPESDSTRADGISGNHITLSAPDNRL